MSSSPAFKITYWGVTGTFCAPLLPHQVSDKITGAIAHLVRSGRLEGLPTTPDLEARIRQILVEEFPFHLRSTYGGNTTCIEVETADELFILDCGSGYRELGVVLESRWKAQGAAARRRAHVLITHAHIDHTFATPYFGPYYNPNNSFTIWGPSVALDSLAAVLDPTSALSQVYFPPTYSEMRGIESFRKIDPDSEFTIGSTKIRTMSLNHPGGSVAYRLENSGRVFVFATDHEQPEVPDRRLCGFAHGADLLYTEGQYTEAEYRGQVGVAGDPPFPRLGWGHSPIEWCVRTAAAAGVRALHVGHCDPRRDDEDIAKLADYLQTVLAAELRAASRPPDSLTALIPHEGFVVEL